MKNNDVIVVCLYNVSNKYGDDRYVYKMKESIDRFLPQAQFICLTNKTDLKNIETKKIKYNWEGVFSKIELFETFKRGKFIYVDLSCVIKKDLSPLINFNEFIMLKDFVNPEVRSSAVMGWRGDYSFITEKFKKNPESYMKEYAPFEKRPEYKKNVKRDELILFTGNKWKSCVDQKFIEDTVGLNIIETWNREYVSSFRLSPLDAVKKSIIVNYHGFPKPHMVNWDPYRKGDVFKYYRKKHNHKNEKI